MQTQFRFLSNFICIDINILLFYGILKHTNSFNCIFLVNLDRLDFYSLIFSFEKLNLLPRYFTFVEWFCNRKNYIENYFAWRISEDVGHLSLNKCLFWGVVSSYLWCHFGIPNEVVGLYRLLTLIEIKISSLSVSYF